MKFKRLKIVTVPYFFEVPTSSRALAPAILPIGMTMVTSALRGAGFDVDQPDLNSIFHTENYIYGENGDEDVFFDCSRVLSFIKGGTDSRLQKAITNILRKTEWDGFDAFLFSCYTIRNVSSIMIYLSMAYLLRKRFPSLIFVVGGRHFPAHVTDSLWNFMREFSLADFIIKGPGESSVVRLFSALGGSTPLDDIPGLIHDKNGIMQRNPESFTPVPILGDFGGLDMELYSYPCTSGYSKGRIKEDNRILVIPYLFTNGCPHNCAFCFASSKHFKTKSVSEVVADLKAISQKFKTRYIYFKDATFNFSYDYTKQLCEEMIKQDLNISWSACVHPDNLDADLLKLMKRSGAKCLIYGFETGSSKLQKYIRKNLDLRHLSEVLRESDRIGLWNGLEVMCGLPYEDDVDIDATIRFIQQNRHVIDEILVSSFRINGYSAFLHDAPIFKLKNLQQQDIFSRISPSVIEYPTENRVIPYTFDEDEGLVWSKKKKQIVISYQRVLMSLRYTLIPIFENISYLFYFYDHLDNKDEIRVVYRRYAKILRKKALFRSRRYFFNELLKIRSFKYLMNRFLYFCGF